MRKKYTRTFLLIRNIYIFKNASVLYFFAHRLKYDIGV